MRPGDGQFGVSVQQQILPRVSVEVGYNRRWLTNFNNVDNVTNVASDFTQFSLPAPSDPRLPGGGGYVVPSLYNINPNVATLQNNVTALASDYGSETNTFNGMLLNLSARPRNGLVFQGGVSTGKTNMDYCSVRTVLPEALNISAGLTGVTDPYCNSTTGWITRYTGLGSYTLPKFDVLISGTFRSDQGAPLAANWAASNAVIQPVLGRPLSNAATERDDQPDYAWHAVRRPRQRGRRPHREDPEVRPHAHQRRVRHLQHPELGGRLSYNQAFVPNGQWLTPTSVILPRFLKFSFQVDF